MGYGDRQPNREPFMPRYVSLLEGAIDGQSLSADTLQTLHRDRPIWVRYDLPAVRTAIARDQLRSRSETMWRYRELLPYFAEDEIVSLGERMSPLLACPRLGAKLGVSNLWIKDESQLPTGSFKSRGMALAITMAKCFGVRRVALPTAGNAGGAAAAYAARAGIECFVFMPADTPIVNQYECDTLNELGALLGNGRRAGLDLGHFPQISRHLQESSFFLGQSFQTSSQWLACF
jgi:threonine synthase